MYQDVRWDEVGEVKIYADFPENPEQRMDSITSSINSGMKALTWSIGLSKSYREPNQIQYNIQRVVGEIGYVVGSTTLLKYLEGTMGPVGAIVKARVKKGSRWGYGFALTDAGELFKPVVNHSINVFGKNNWDFYTVFGTANTGCPRTSVDILEMLYGHDDTRIQDLADKIKCSSASVISGHLAHLKKANLLDYTSISTHRDTTDVFQYELVGSLDEIEDLREGKKRFNVEKVKSALNYASRNPRNKGRFTSHDLARKGKYSKRSAENIIRLLVESGVLHSVNFIGRRKHSSVRLTEEGREFNLEWIKPVREALESEDFLSLQTSVPSDVYIETSLRFSRTSPYVNSKRSDDRIDEIVSIIRETPGITTNILKEQTGLKPSRIGSLVRDAVKLGLITRRASKKSNSVRRLYPKSN